jgi:[ribosomal protein S18]-alanine N-acetyltransferase
VAGGPILVRDFSPADAAAIMEIQLATPEMAQWRAEDYHKLSRTAGGTILVAESNERRTQIAGFIAMLALGEEAEVQNLAVRAGHRRRGIARALLQDAHRRLARQSVMRVFLEVRRSNVAAIELYKSLSYSPCGLRPRYYLSDGEDALVLSLRLSNPATA